MSDKNSNTNARTDLQREEDEGQHYSDSFDSGQAGFFSQDDEYQSQRSNRTLGSYNGYAFRVARLGGIYSRLKQLQAQHLAYVDAHGQRLEARLQENRQHKTQVLREISVLEKELLQLIEEAQSRINQE